MNEYLTEFISNDGHKFTPGDVFRLRSEPGAIFTFIHFFTDKGGPTVRAYGGSKDPNGQRAIRSFVADLKFIPVKARVKRNAAA